MTFDEVIKNVNDTFGHYIGDQLLFQFAGILCKSVRPTDFVCRFGGDEFFIIMPSSGLADGIGIAKRIQNSLKGVPPPIFNEPILLFQWTQ